MTTRFAFRWVQGTACGLALAAGAWSARAQSVQDTVQVQGAIGNFGTAALDPGASPPRDNGDRFVPAKVLTKTSVQYPTLADLNRAEGVVSIRFYLDETGHVTKTGVAKTGTSILLDALARDPRLMDWTFQPATLDGKPVPSTHDQEFEFKLDEGQQRALAVRRLALPIGTPDPPYPDAAVARRLEGSATIAVVWTKQGLVGTVSLVKSSGAPLLDATALRYAYENWRIDPAAAKPGEPFVKLIKFTPP